MDGDLEVFQAIANHRSQGVENAVNGRTLHRRLYRLFPVVALVALSLLAGCSRHEFVATLFDQPRPATEIRGTNWNGEPFQLSDLQGRYVLVFFGYTSCPDICPFTLGELSKAYNQLLAEDPDVAQELAVVFITLDPDRDTPERLAEYVPYFHADFYGVYLPPEELEEVKAAYGIYSEKRDVSDVSAAGYLIDHTATIYLIDPQGRVKGLFPHDVPAEDLVADLSYLLR